MTTNTIKKVLAGEEDITYGEGTETQVRSEVEVEVSQVRAGYRPCATVDEMNALDPLRFPRASVIEDGQIKFYAHNGTSYEYIQVHGTNLEGRETAIDFLDGTAYFQLAGALPAPSLDTESSRMRFTIKLRTKDSFRFLAGEGTLATPYQSIAIRGTNLVVTSDTGVEQLADLTPLNLPIDEFIVVDLEMLVTGVNKAFRLTYNTISTSWVTDNTLTGEWRKFYGYGVLEAGIFGAIQKMEYLDAAGLTYGWSFSNVVGRTIPCNIYGYEGFLIGNAYQASDPVFSDALSVSFDPTGTAYNPSTATNVDAVLREVDSTFQRKGTGGVLEPTPPDGTPLEAYEIWLADSTAAPVSRPLPVAPNDGEEITIRDDAGAAGTNIITIGRAGKTVMGLAEDLTITTNWSWIRLKYFETLDDWRVVGGGVGGQVKIIPSDVAEALYPVGHILLTMNSNNPASYLQFGVWQIAANGMFLAGIGNHSDTNGTLGNTEPRANTGEWSHQITIPELPAHSHETLAGPDTFGQTNSSEKQVPLGGGGSTGPSTKQPASVGNDALMNIRNPSFGVYVWERIV